MKKVKWGILGCARIAWRALIPAITKSSNGILYGIASRDYKNAKSWIKKYGFHKAYPDYQSLLDDPEIDAVYIPLPNHLHCVWTSRSAKAGKHILCEKPIAMNTAEVKKMIRETDKYDVLLMEAFMYRFHPQHNKVLKLIESGEIGNIRTFHSSFSFQYSAGKENYRSSPKMGGGALMDVGCYAINASRLIIGKEPISVYARAHFDPKLKIDLSYSLLLEFPDYQTALLNCSFESQFQNTYTVVGTKGKITVPRAFIPKLQKGIVEFTKEDKLKTFTTSSIDQYSLMVEHFCDCISHNKRLPRFPADDAFYNMRVINAAQQSAKTGRVIHLKNMERKI